MKGTRKCLIFLPSVCSRLQPTTSAVPRVRRHGDALPRVPSRELRAASNAAGVQPLRTVRLPSSGATTDAAVFRPSAATLPPTVPTAALVIRLKLKDGQTNVARLRYESHFHQLIAIL